MATATREANSEVFPLPHLPRLYCSGKTPAVAISRSCRSLVNGDRGHVPTFAVSKLLSGQNALRDCACAGILITRHGKPAGVLIGFESENDWFEYRLENDPRFLQRMEKARSSLRRGQGMRLEEL